MENDTQKAYENLSFLNSHDARPIRVLCELIEPSVRLDDQEIKNTLVFFGSARSKSLDQAEKELKELLDGQANSEEEESKERKALIRKAETTLRLSKYYDDAEKLAERISLWSMKNFDPKDQFHICSGGGPGMMEAANKGARRANAKSIGLGISLPFEQGLNSFVTPELAFEFHYFFIRKFYFLYHAKAVVVFPGGFGTMDELFEALTLIQTKKIGKEIPIYLYGKTFWEELINFEKFLEWGVISEQDLGLLKIVDEVDQAFDNLVRDLGKGSA